MSHQEFHQSTLTIQSKNDGGNGGCFNDKVDTEFAKLSTCHGNQCYIRVIEMILF